MNKKERIEDAIANLLVACDRTGSERYLALEDQLMATAAYAAGYISAKSDVTLNLEHDTEWLQARFEVGREEAQRA